MSPIMTWIRRLVWIVALGVGIGVAVSWWRDRTAPPAPKNPPEWPPLTADSASVATAVVTADAPPAASTPSHDAWVEPDVGGACPLSHPIKANGNSGIFHVPGGRFYARTKAERCYSTPESAEADGYRRAKS